MSRVMVLAPHPDDDVIGCGGTLHRLVNDGASVTVMYLTDGSASHPGSKRFPPSAIAKLRRQEARDGLAQLAIRTEPIFLRMRDGSLSSVEAEARQSTVGEIVRAAIERDIDTIFAPWEGDAHADHAATASFLQEALELLGPGPRVFWYLVWAGVREIETSECALRSRRTVRVPLALEDVEAKRRALLQHRTQTSGLISDDCDGFRISDEQMAVWLRPSERFVAEGQG